MPKDKIEDLHRRLDEVKVGGGPERIAKQHEAGKMTARERIEGLLDPGSFVELGTFVEHRCSYFDMDKVKPPGEGVVTGYGKIEGRLVYIFAQDFTVMGGSLGEMHAEKICQVQDLALKSGAPLIGINDSGGARIQEGIDSLNGYGEIFKRNTWASGVIPQISLIMGPCAGGAVYSPALTDFVFMVEGTSQMFITGPQVIKAATGEEITHEELGGSDIHNRESGVAHFKAESEEKCFQLLRELLTYIPSSSRVDPPQGDSEDSADRESQELNEIIPPNPNLGYDVKDVIKTILDHESFFEVHREFAANLVVGFGRLDGRSVGVVANQPKKLAGCLDIDGADKASRFIRFCDAFNIPILTLVDTPGYLPGTRQEHGGIIRHGAKLPYAYSEATVPKVTLILRKAYGGAYLAMCSKAVGADQVFAWPSAEIAVMGPEGAANIIFRKEISQAVDPEDERKGKIDLYKEQFAHPYVAAARGYVDSVIEPKYTRPTVVKAIEALLAKEEQRPCKKHGIIPL
ncbi:MAG: methylmalonyl-CoA carboxyltransferase [Clostridia bacterium]|nr:methylmalonyl-CoA carboxyltransferase [Clostridia bacterium]